MQKPARDKLARRHQPPTQQLASPPARTRPLAAQRLFFAHRLQFKNGRPPRLVCRFVLRVAAAAVAREGGSIGPGQPASFVQLRTALHSPPPSSQLPSSATQLLQHLSSHALSHCRDAIHEAIVIARTGSARLLLSAAKPVFQGAFSAFGKASLFCFGGPRPARKPERSSSQPACHHSHPRAFKLPTTRPPHPFSAPSSTAHLVTFISRAIGPFSSAFSKAQAC
jgi:hypothetical protein